MKDEHFAELMASVAEARAFARGESVPGLRVHSFPATAEMVVSGQNSNSRAAAE